jgi:hypothetical protein
MNEIQNSANAAKCRVLQIRLFGGRGHRARQKLAAKQTTHN